MDRGKFIVVEGLDGSGKGTQIELLRNALNERGISVHITAEPTDGDIGKYIRQILTGNIKADMCVQAALFLADRLWHITDGADGILAHLNNGETVICDRYYYSSIAYQGTATSMDWVMKMNLDSPAMLVPDLCVFLDVDAEVCMERINKSRDNIELYEGNIALMNEIRSNFYSVFHALKKTDNIRIINANQDVDSVAKDVFGTLISVF